MLDDLALAIGTCETKQFVDEVGRVRLFHGINSVIKHFPWYDEGMRDPARHRQIAEWGFTAVRSVVTSP